MAGGNLKPPMSSPARWEIESAKTAPWKAAAAPETEASVTSGWFASHDLVPLSTSWNFRSTCAMERSRGFRSRSRENGGGHGKGSADGSEWSSQRLGA